MGLLLVVGTLLDDDLLQAFDAVFGEGWHCVVANADHLEVPLFGIHAGRDFPQPRLILAEHFGDTGDREDDGDAGHFRLPEGSQHLPGASSTAAAHRGGTLDDWRCGRALRASSFQGRR